MARLDMTDRAVLIGLVALGALFVVYVFWRLTAPPPEPRAACLAAVAELARADTRLVEADDTPAGALRLEAGGRQYECLILRGRARIVEVP